MKRVQEKVAVVTGAARGLGLAMVTRLAEQGAHVLFTDIDSKEGLAQEERLHAAGLSVAFEVQDVTDPARWPPLLEAARARWGRLDVVVNNAGVAYISDIEATTLAQWRTTLAVNLDGVFLGTQAAIAAMKGQGGGSIINIASIEALVGEALIPAYNASKAAARLLTKSAAIHCARKGYDIRINNVCPGFVDTQLVSGAMATLPSDEAQAFASRVLSRIPQGRFGEPLDIAQAVLFLASDESRYMTGSDLVVDGGYTAG